EDHLGLVISPQSPLSAGYITLRACRRSLPLRFSTVTPGGIVGVLIVSYPTITICGQLSDNMVYTEKHIRII
ncbi:hypothetical protein, partial [Escherichia coli]|uniref:hypothetical protein n=1 Tax=Escherichia coli TaxID=562 RepID=UPI00359E8112